ncbi:unnamed protein product [Larinioides sclopetarius]|uniref:LAGLIDADG homing endonuclease n=1 Tax=Larinioides sclopetarius TaxID=280406 RepID=A0AAV2BE01_9ARAC
METWYVMMHTDSLDKAKKPDCLIIKFGRRMSFNSEIRMDIIHSKESQFPSQYNAVGLRRGKRVHGVLVLL